LVAGAAHKPTHFDFGDSELSVTELEKPEDDGNNDADFD
jgi:hypothetical protein